MRRSVPRSEKRLPPKKRKVAGWCSGGGAQITDRGKQIRCAVCGRRLTPRLVHRPGDDPPLRFVPRHKEK